MKNNKLRIVLDTNVFLVSLSPKFKYYWIFEKMKNGEYELFVSNDILTEYEEKVASNDVNDFINECLLNNIIIGILPKIGNKM